MEKNKHIPDLGTANTTDQANPSELTAFIAAEEDAATTANNNPNVLETGTNLTDSLIEKERPKRLSKLMMALYATAVVLSLLGAVQQLFAAVRFGLALQLPEQMDGVKDGDMHSWWPMLKECQDGTCVIPGIMGISSYLANVILGVMFFPNTLISMSKSFALLAILIVHLPQMLCSSEHEQLPTNLLDYTPIVSYPFPKHYEHLKPPTLAFAVFDILSLLTSWTTIPIYVVLSMEAITDLVKNIGLTAYVFLASTVIVNWCSRYVGSKEMFRKTLNSIPFWPDFLTNKLGLWPRSQAEKNALQNLSYVAKHIRRTQFELSEDQRSHIANLTEPKDAIEDFLTLTNSEGKRINFSYTWQEFWEEIGPSLVACMSLIVYFDIARDGAKDLHFPNNILLQSYIALPNFLYYLMMFPMTALSAYVGHNVLKNKFGPCTAKFLVACLAISALFAGGNMADKFLEFVAGGGADWLNPENSPIAYYALYGSLTLSGLLCSTFPNFIAYITVVQYCYDEQRGDFVELLNDIETELTKAIADPTYDGYTEYSAIVGMWRQDNERTSSADSKEYHDDASLSDQYVPLLRNAGAYA